ncbi:MAG: hypothetical protein H6594_03435 [Flavobacteriales bacterium]|nr:hypothetical protein [Flavobacteriales bacterium]
MKYRAERNWTPQALPPTIPGRTLSDQLFDGELWCLVIIGTLIVLFR